MTNEVTRNLFVYEDNERLERMLLRRIPQLNSSQIEIHLSLAKYFRKRPWIYHCDASYRSFLAWLEALDRENRKSLQQYIGDNTGDLNSALRTLDEVNNYSWHDATISLDVMDVVRFIDQSVHPAYVRICEGVWTPLLRIAAFRSRQVKGKGTSGLDSFNIAQELRNGALDHSVWPFRPTIRNGIAHGNTEYRDYDIWYTDKRGIQESLSGREMIRLFDDLLDICNGLALGLSVFLLTRQADGYALPQQILFEELKAQTECPWWHVEACIPAVRIDHTQLTIYVRANTYDHRKAEHSELQTGVLAGFLAPGYDRYFLSVRSKKAHMAMAAFKGSEIQKLRMLSDLTFKDCVNIIDDGIFGYMPRIRFPRILLPLDTYLISIRIHWSRLKEEWRRLLNRPVISIRGIEAHMNGWRCVVNGQAIVQLQEGKEVDKAVLRSIRRRLVKRAFSVARRGKPGWSPVRYMPLGYARISVFRKDYRERRLDCFGLDADLICTVQMKRIRRIQAPDIMSSSVEQLGSYRIAWNRAWLDTLPSDPCQTNGK